MFYMKTRFVIATFLFFMVLYSCSSYEIITKPLVIDSKAVGIFSTKINSRFPDYAEVSGYNHFRDSVKIAMKNIRGPDGEPVMFFRGRPSKENIVIYTFDKKDSCIIFSGILLNENYILHINSLLIPIGKYLLKSGNVLSSFNRE